VLLKIVFLVKASSLAAVHLAAEAPDTPAPALAPAPWCGLWQAANRLAKEEALSSLVAKKSW
jgi:hypothetical protein